MGQHFSDSADGVRKPKRGGRQRLREIAKAQRHVNIAVLMYFGLLVLAGILSGMFGEAAWINVVLAIGYGSTVIFGAVGVYRLTSRLQGTSTAVIYTMGMIVPFVGLLILLAINSAASTLLRDKGIRIGLLGANPADI